MALANTVGAYFIPGARNNSSDYTPPKGYYIQTGSSAVTELTAAACTCLQSASTAKLGCGTNAFHLCSLNFSIEKPSSTAEVSVHLGACKIAQLPTGTAGVFCLDYGPWGIVGPDDVTTNTVSIVASVGGATVKCWALTGYYEV